MRGVSSCTDSVKMRQISDANWQTKNVLKKKYYRVDPLTDTVYISYKKIKEYLY